MKQITHNTEATPNNHTGLNCSLCLYYETCDHNEPCEYLAPVDDDAYTEAIMEQIRAEGSSVYHDCADSNLDIDCCLRDIRAGRIAYVYDKEHLAEILHFEPNINVVPDDGIFYILL